MTACPSYLRRPSRVKTVFHQSSNEIEIWCAFATGTRTSSQVCGCNTTTIGGCCPRSDKNAVHMRAFLDSVVMDRHRISWTGRLPNPQHSSAGAFGSAYRSTEMDNFILLSDQKRLIRLMSNLLGLWRRTNWCLPKMDEEPSRKVKCQS